MKFTHALTTTLTALALCATTAQAARIGLAWDDTQNTTQTGYVIERRVNTPGTVYAELARVPGAAVRTYTDATAAEGGQYCYQVRAYGATLAQVSLPSNEACAQALTVLLAPVNLILTAPAQ